MNLESCTDIHAKECPALDLNNIERKNCKEDRQCTEMDKMFRCEFGVCWNITSVYACTYDEADAGPPVSCRKKRNCVELEGMYDCEAGTCKRIEKWSCERRCVDMPVKGKNVIVQSGDNIVLANCERAVQHRTGEVMWNAQDHRSRLLMTSCTEMYLEGSVIRGHDCINGSLLPDNILGDVTNYTVLNSVMLNNGYANKLDLNDNFLPFESDMTIFNHSRLMINHEGCVNTLQEECELFYEAYGRDGRNQTSPARFPCFYAPHNSDFVVKRFDLDKTKWVFLMFFTIPAGLLIVSCSFLFTCSRVLNIDNTGHMIMRCCGSGGSNQNSKTLVTVDDDLGENEGEKL